MSYTRGLGEWLDFWPSGQKYRDYMPYVDPHFHVLQGEGVNHFHKLGEGMKYEVSLRMFHLFFIEHEYINLDVIEC